MSRKNITQIRTSIDETNAIGNWHHVLNGYFLEERVKWFNLCMLSYDLSYRSRIIGWHYTSLDKDKTSVSQKGNPKLRFNQNMFQIQILTEPAKLSSPA